jgi:hypothetical protein
VTDHTYEIAVTLEANVVRLKDRVTLLETLIRKYAYHVGCCEGVSFLEQHYRGAYGAGSDFTTEEWDEVRRIAGETDT